MEQKEWFGNILVDRHQINFQSNHVAPITPSNVIALYLLARDRSNTISCLVSRCFNIRSYLNKILALPQINGKQNTKYDIFT